MTTTTAIEPESAEHEIYTERASRAERVAGFLQRQGAATLLIGLVVVAAAVFPNFRTYGNVTNILLQASGLGIIAVGMTCVIITGGIDLSVGSQYALGGVLGAWAAQYGFVTGALAPLLGCGLLGLVQGMFIGRFSMPPFIVTLAGLLGIRGLALWVTNEGRTIPKVEWESLFAAVGHTQTVGIAVPVYLAAVVFAAGWLFLRQAARGRSLYAIGGSESAATLMGLPVARTKVLVYTLSGVCAGLAGMLNAAYTISGVPTQGVGWELDAIAAVVIGGTLLVGGSGSVLGTLAGVLLLKVILNVINQVGSLDASFQMVVSGAFLTVVVVIQAILTRAQGLREL